MDRDFFDRNQPLREIFDNMGDAVYFVDNQGVILFMNKAAEKLDGYTFKETRGKTVMEMYHLEASESPLLRVICSHEPLRNHFFRYYINNQEVYQICNTFPIQLDNGFWGSFSIQQDVTRFKKTIDRNIELQKQLFSNVTHDSDGEKSKSNLYTFENIIGDHQSLMDCKLMAYNAAKGDSSIMLTGLTGTGKELFAQSIHSASKRRRKPFLAINCAAIPETLIEGILFGTVKGVYTGALDRKGLFEEADGGTLFLDEVNSMPISAQAKLLRVLEEKHVLPLGSKERIPIDTRIISSCNAYPQDVMKNKEIREDLFYRLAVVNILIPPLRERKSDIYLLAYHFITGYNELYDKNVLCMEDEITTFFLNYEWPGNVRQLKHCIECAMNLVGPGETSIKKHHLPFYLVEKKSDSSDFFYQEFQNFDKTPEPQSYDSETGSHGPVSSKEAESIFDSIRREERGAIISALRKSGGNVSRAAKEMGLSRQTLVYRMKKYEIY
jgi:arginine utilization regulatory protein